MSEIKIEVNGVDYENFESASIDTQLDAMSGAFDFEAVSTQKQPLPFKLDDLCVIKVDGFKLLTGFIEQISVNYESGSHSISLSGRSKTTDLIDSTINSLEIKPTISLKRVIEKVVSHIGSDVKVIDNVGNIAKFNKAEDILSPEVGGNAFEFIEKLARKRQVLLTTNGDGDVVIVKPAQDIAPVALQNIIGSDRNNIQSASVNYDSTGLYNRYIVSSQLNMTAINQSGSDSNNAIVNQKSPTIIDSEVRSSRQLVLQAENASSVGQSKDRAKWEANIRKTRSIVYSTSLPNFSFNGKLWEVNQLTQINDEFAGINEIMLLNSLTYSLAKSGSTLTMTFVNKDSYTLLLNEPSKGGQLGVGFS